MNIFLHFRCVRLGGAPYEKAFDQAARSCDHFRDPIIGGWPRFRVGWLRSEPASQRMGRVRLGWSKSRLVPETNRPSGHADARRDVALFSVKFCARSRLSTQVP